LSGLLFLIFKCATYIKQNKFNSLFSSSFSCLAVTIGSGIICRVIYLFLFIFVFVLVSLILDYVFIDFLFSLFPKQQQQVVGCQKTQLLAQQTQLQHTDQITQLLMMWTPLKKTLLKKTTQHQVIQLWILMTSTLLKMLIIAMETHLILKVIIKGVIFIVIRET
jgi:hypothetical protein